VSQIRLAYELEQVRMRGYAYDNEEVLPGLCCVSAPIHNVYGKAVAGISLVITANRFYQQQDNYATAVLDTAQRISEKIGYRVKKQRTSRRRITVSFDEKQ
jgi:IclR family transcriptional regulator, KDG regulon repressor